MTKTGATIVTSQAELDAAIATRTSVVVVETAERLEVRCAYLLRLEVRGTSSALVVTHDTSSAEVVTYDTSSATKNKRAVRP